MKSEKEKNTILIVDDDPVNLAVLNDYLCNNDFKVLAAEDGENAIKQADYLKPDLILLDLMLPDIDGFDVIKRLKANRRTRDIPVIFQTVAAETAHKVKGFELGAVDYITKPINLEELLVRIDTHITIRNLQRNLVEKNRQLHQEIARHKRTGEALQQSEAHYRRLVEFNPGAIVIHSEGKILYMNNAALKLVGAVDLQEVIGKSVLDFVHTDFHQIVIQRIRRMQQEGETAPILEEKFIRLDGGTLNVEVIGIPITYQGKVASQLIVHDITARKQTEEALRQSEIAYKELADSITDLFFAMDNNLKYIYWNKASEILTGVPAADALGKSLYDLFPDVEGTKTEEIYLDVLQTKQPRSFENEFRLAGKDYIFDIRVYPARAGLAVIGKDITKHKQDERALAQTNRLLQTILDSTHMMVAYLDADFNFVWVNRAYAEADQRDPSFFPGKNHFDLYPDADNKEIFKQAAATGQPYFAYAKPFEYPRHPERGVSYWDWSLIPIMNPEGAVTSLVLTLVDITRRIKAEEQVKASLREKEVLLKEVHHRVKNNLQVINSLLNLQSRRLDDKKIAAVFEEVKNRIYSIALIHEKLYESKNLANIDFAEYTRVLVSHLCKTFPSNLAAVKLDIKAEAVQLQVDKAIPCALIINEMVTNALKYAFTDNRKGEITVEFKTTPDDNLVLTVADNGVGLPKDYDTNPPKALGMQIINALVMQLHGVISLDTSNGTKFTVEFPVKAGK